DVYRRQQPCDERDGKCRVEDTGPCKQANRRIAHTERAKREAYGSGQGDNSSSGAGKLQEKTGRREGRKRHGLISFLRADGLSTRRSSSDAKRSFAERSLILRARRSSCLRSRTSLSTIPSRSASAEPPQKRSIMFRTARTATF